MLVSTNRIAQDKYDLLKIRNFKTAASVSFANTTKQYAANSVKLNMIIENWPFKSIQNSLALILDSQNTQKHTQSCIQSGKDISGNLVWFQITVNGVAMNP